jgi:hypothetical protein
MTVTCPSPMPATSESQSCGTGYTGNQTRTRSVNCPNGGTGWSLGGWGDWNRSACVVAASSQTCTYKSASIGSYYFYNQSPSALFGICATMAIQPGASCLFSHIPCYQAGYGQSGVNPNGAPVLYRDDGSSPAVCGPASGVSSSSRPSANLCSVGSSTGILDRGSLWTWACYPGVSGEPVECQSPKTTWKYYASGTVYGGIQQCSSIGALLGGLCSVKGQWCYVDRPLNGYPAMQCE